MGVVLIFLGFAGEGYKREEQVLLKAGQQVEIGRYTVRNDAIRISDDGRKQMVTSYMTVSEDGKEVGKMYPARWFFRKHESEPTTEVAIRRTITEDLYIVLAAYTVEDQTGQFQVVVNPLVNWIWLGFGVLALGTGIALLPERTFSYALARLPPESPVPAAAAPLVLLLLLTPTVSLLAQEPVLPHEQLEQTTVLLVPKTELEKDLHRSIICMCGTCGRKNLAECTCSEAGRMREEIAGLASQGKSRDEIIQYHIDKYGSQEPLAAPLDQGFNRLAWLFPYLLGAGGLVVAAFAAVRWSRHAAASSRKADEASDSSPELEARLDDELSKLD